MPALARMLKGPKNLLESLWDGQVVWKNFALTRACSLTVNSGAGDLLASVGPWYRSWALEIADLSS